MVPAFHTHDVIKLARDIKGTDRGDGEIIDLSQGLEGTIVQSYPDHQGHHRYLVEFNPPGEPMELVALTDFAHNDLLLVWCCETKSGTCSGWTDFVRPAAQDSGKHLKRAAGE